MSKLHLTATAAAGLILGVFGFANYLLDGRPFHTPIATGYWAGDQESMSNPDNTSSPKYLTLEDMAARNRIQPVGHPGP